MQINRNNYEEYFILYMDNELDATTRQEVETFAAAHPDLREELDLLLQTKLSPDITMEYGDKSELMQFDITDGINAGNYESWLLMYADNELSTADRILTEKFIASHATAAQELWLLQQSHLEPEQIVFEGKESLYRREEKRRPFIRWQMAAAAVLLLAVSTTALILNNRNNDQATGTGTPGIASITPGEKNHATTKLIPVEEQPVMAQPATKKVENDFPTEQSLTQELKNTSQVQTAKHIADQTKNTSADVVTVSSNSNSNKPAVERLNNVVSNISNEKQQTGTQMINEASIANAKMTQQQNSNTPVVTTKASDTYNKVDEPAATTNDIIYASENTGKKSKLRGFFRKVTRTFEKKTNIDPTDDDDRLLVGGLAIRLK